MRKLNKVKQLGRTASHRKAMLRNMLEALLLHERIKSTKAKLKALQVMSEKVITRAKKIHTLDEAKDKLHQKRILFRLIRNRDIAAKLFDDIAPRYLERNGGYTRLIKLAPRQGDASEMALLELVEFREKKKRESKKEKPEKKGK